MRVTFLRCAAVALALVAAAATAGPVTRDEAGAPPLALPELGAAADADPAASSAAALATKILEEAQAGASADDTPAASRPRPAARAAASAPARAGSAASAPAAAGQAARKPEESPLRKAAKAAVEWVKDAVPWLRSEGDGADEGPARPPETVEWQGAGPDGGVGGAGGLSGSGFGGLGHGPGGAAGLPPAGPASADETLRQLMREAVEMVTAVITHPMTWLVIAIFAAGGYAMNKFDRRPK
jgi:hypothetical protein